MSQPNSFQEYAPSGTPDRQYMMAGNPRQPQAGDAAYHMPSSQPSSGVLTKRGHMTLQPVEYNHDVFRQTETMSQSECITKICST